MSIFFSFSFSFLDFRILLCEQHFKIYCMKIQGGRSILLFSALCHAIVWQIVLQVWIIYDTMVSYTKPSIIDSPICTSLQWHLGACLLCAIVAKYSKSLIFLLKTCQFYSCLFFGLKFMQMPAFLAREIYFLDGDIQIAILVRDGGRSENLGRRVLMWWV